jgi:dihydrofolate reductase
VKLSFIVATSENGVIGKDNTIPWYLPADFAYFKKTTMGHPIIMGRKTYQSIGRPLPGRLNIVVTRDASFHPEGTRVASSLEDAIEAASQTGTDEAFIIGGSSLFDAAINQADRIYLTLVHAQAEGDVFFKFNPAGWQQISKEKHQADENNKFSYDFLVLDRKQS